MKSDDNKESLRKRVRLSLASGDREGARRAIYEAIPSEEEAEFLYLQHLAEEEERTARDQYSQFLEIEEEELLLLSLEALKIDEKDGVLCPICSQSDLYQNESKIIMCEKCDLQLFFDRTLFEFRDLLCSMLGEHSFKCNCKPTFKMDHSLVLYCEQGQKAYSIL